MIGFPASGIGSSMIQTAYAATAFAVLARFGQIDALEELNGDNMHRLENVLTLNSDTHTLFDTLKIWLERSPAVS
jgi:hypothetical protein